MRPDAPLPSRSSPRLLARFLRSALDRISDDQGYEDLRGAVLVPLDTTAAPPVAPKAVDAALELAVAPILASTMRRQPLPPGVLTLIQIAAGSAEVIQRCVVATGRDAAYLRAAATVYIEQVLWAPGGDHYRALGVSADDRPRNLAKHLLWFAKWVSEEWGWHELEDAYTAKVLKAWNALKTPELRRRYDRSCWQLSQRVSPRNEALSERDHDRRSLLRPRDSRSPAQRRGTARWSVTASVLALVAVSAVASLTWFVFHPRTASASSVELQTASLNRSEVSSDGSRRVRTMAIVGSDQEESRPLLLDETNLIPPR